MAGAGWTSGRLSEVIRGKRELTLRMVRQLVNELDMSPHGLLGADLPREAVWLRSGVSRLLDQLAQRDGVPRALVIARALAAYKQQTATIHDVRG